MIYTVKSYVFLFLFFGGVFFFFISGVECIFDFFQYYRECEGGEGRVYQDFNHAKTITDCKITFLTFILETFQRKELVKK